MIQNKIEVSKELKDLIHRCILLTDRRGRKLRKESNPVTACLEMEYNDKKFRIWFYVTANAMAGGSYQMKVIQGKSTLLKAEGYSGGFYVYPYEPNVSAYISGAWEKKIPPL